MWFEIIVALGGAVFGLLVQPVLRVFGYELEVERLGRRLQTIIAPHPTEVSHNLQCGNLRIADWVILDGFSKNGLKIETEIEHVDIELPNDLKTLRQQIEVEIQKDRANGKAVPYNGKKYALAALRFHRSDDPDELNLCHMRLKYSDYFNFLAVAGALDRDIPGSHETVRQRYFRNVDPYDISNDFLFSSFGVNVVVITADNQLVMVKRGKDVFRPEVLNSTVNEGLSRDLDTESGRGVSVYNAGLRGLFEELGVEASDVKEYKLTSIGFDRKWCQYGALGYARLKISFSDLSRRLSISKDASFEIGSHQRSTDAFPDIQYSLYGIKNTPQAFAAFLEEQTATITSSGLACYLLSFLSTDWSFRDLDKSFREPRWKDTSFII